MDCPGFNSRSERCIYRVSRPSQGTVNGGAVSKCPRCRWDVKHNQPNIYIYIRLQVKLYDKRDDFNFNIVNFPFLSSNIPQSPAYGVYVSQLIRYARASSAYSDFLVRSRLLTGKLLGQGYNRFKLISTFKKFYGRHYDLIVKFQHSVTRMVTDLFLETLFLR